MNVKQVLSEALGGVQGANQPRGLHNFIQEIRLCSNSAKEQVSVVIVRNAIISCSLAVQGALLEARVRTQHTYRTQDINSCCAGGNTQTAG